MTDSPAPSTADASVTEQRPPSVLIRFIIFFTMAVALAMVALIWVRWFSYAEPSSMVIIEADARDAGVIINIARVRPNFSLAAPVQIELSEQNNYTARYFLEAGQYQISAVRAEQVLLNFLVNLREHRAYRASLVGRLPATAPTQVTDGQSGR